MWTRLHNLLHGRVQKAATSADQRWSKLETGTMRAVDAKLGHVACVLRKVDEETSRHVTVSATKEAP